VRYVGVSDDGRSLEVANQIAERPHDGSGLTAFRDSGMAVAPVLVRDALIRALPSLVSEARCWDRRACGTARSASLATGTGFCANQRYVSGTMTCLA
jgi:hypothetical protein